MDKKEQYRSIAKTQNTWATLARNDARYNITQAARDFSQGNVELGKMHMAESRWDETFATLRKKRADHPERFYK